MLRLVASAVCLAIVGCAGQAPRAKTPAEASTWSANAPAPHPLAGRASREDALHLLRRFTFGPRAAEVAEATGRLPEWFEAQLSLQPGRDTQLQLALAPYAWVLKPPKALKQQVRDAKKLKRRCRALRSAWGRADAANDRQLWTACTRPAPRIDWLPSVQMSAVARHIAAQGQLREVMVDFWTNHFNVYARKHGVTYQVADYVEHTIRPHALGRFPDMLHATAHHAAMLHYLDNARSAAERTRPDRAARAVNENYARELLELHTLGVDGGYTQRDVTEAARVLTGFSVEATSGGFRFKPGRHDPGAKRVLGHDFPAGGGQEEGERLLELLAAHPSTARFIATKLVQRFVSDEPDAACVDDVASAYRRTHGDIPAMLRALVACDSFWTPATRGAKAKRPLEFVASAIRVLHGVPDGEVALSRWLAELGQAPFMMAAPTGYSDEARSWVHARAMGARMAFADRLASRRIAGIVMPSPQPPDAPESVDDLVRWVDEEILLGEAGETTLQAIRDAAAGLDHPRRRRALAISLALSSPEFQRR